MERSINLDGLELLFRELCVEYLVELFSNDELEEVRRGVKLGPPASLSGKLYESRSQPRREARLGSWQTGSW
eukprot:6316420-Pyramimonas_sp.AAC.1